MRKTMKWVWPQLLSLIVVALGDWIDSDTPADRQVTRSLVDGTEYKLVMSDEFDMDGRSFKDGDDPTWTGLDKPDDYMSSDGRGALQFYNSSKCRTEDGFLQIETTSENYHWDYFDWAKNKYKQQKTHFKSCMMQSWNKFCFRGGIVEIDYVLPGRPEIGGLWPALWMMGNLGRSTYLPSTNRIWPWSFNECNRDLQGAQLFSACNYEDHYGLNHQQGRGSTEIDILEMVAGQNDASGQPIPNTDPPIKFPYLDYTLQVAPGVPKNRPVSGYPPRRDVLRDVYGNPVFGSKPQVWYDGMEFGGNTSLNPYFYGQFLGVTEKNEPVQRTADQTFQADAVSAMGQAYPEHFTQTQTIRLEWQPGEGGRLDWFVKSQDESNDKFTKVYTIHDSSLKNVTGAQIPLEPSYLIFNTAVSSTWAFPTSLPPGCSPCYDCFDPKCQCSFNPGFCEMVKDGVSFKIDNVRVYQTSDDDAHVGLPHILGCDPEEYPSRRYIEGNEVNYMRQVYFGYDAGALEKHIKSGGADCNVDTDCGKGVCGPPPQNGFLWTRRNKSKTGKVCRCEGTEYTGPSCRSKIKQDDEPGAFQIYKEEQSFKGTSVAPPYFPTSLAMGVVALAVAFCIAVIVQHRRLSQERKEARSAQQQSLLWSKNGARSQGH